MSSLRSKTDAQIAKTRSAKPEFMQQVDELLRQAEEFQQGKNALQIGQAVPDFTLPDAKGNAVSLAEVLTSNIAIVTFYRGSWCPYCNLQLNALKQHLPAFNALGAQLIAVSPEVPDGSLSNAEIADMPFTVVSDQDAKVAAQFGVAWEVPEILIEHMRKDRNLDLAQINNGNATILPIPATFIINKAQTLSWRFVDLDYRRRAEPEDMLKALQQL